MAVCVESLVVEMAVGVDHLFLEMLKDVCEFVVYGKGMRVVCQHLSVGVDCLFVAADGWAGELVVHVAPLYAFGSGDNQWVEYLEGDIVVFAELLSNGIEAVGEVVDKNSGQVHIATVFMSGAIDVRRDHADELLDDVFRWFVVAFDAEGELAVFECHIAHKRLRRPKDAIAGAGLFQHIDRGGSGSVEYDSVTEVQLGGDVVEGIVGDGNDVDVGGVFKLGEIVDGLCLDTVSKVLRVF